MKTNLTLLTALLLIGCGTRKATTNKSIEKESSKVEVKAESETVTTTNTQINTVTIDTSTTNEIVIEPINPLVEFIVNGKTYKNARITTKKVKAGVVKSEVVKVAKNEENKAKIEATEQNQSFKKAKPRVTERKSGGYFWFWVGFGGSACLYLLFLWLRNKYKKAKEVIS